MLTSLSAMTCLSYLRLDDCEDRFHLQFMADQLIYQSQRSLQQVILGFDFSFPSPRQCNEDSRGRCDHWPRLRVISCWRLSHDSVLDACPRLLSLTCFQPSPVTLSMLSVKHGLSLQTLKTGPMPLSADALRHVADMTSLRVMHVETAAAVLFDQATGQSFVDSMTNLEEVKLTIHYNGNMDQLVVRLCQRNVQLHTVKLFMDESEVSDAALLALSDLKNLKRVAIDVDSSRMTTKGLQVGRSCAKGY